MSVDLLLTGLAPAISFVVCLAILPTLIETAHRRKFFDQPGTRKIHSDPIPQMGGVAIFSAFILSFLFTTLLAEPLWDRPLLPSRWEGLSLVLCFLGMHLTGLLDDLYDMRARYKLLGQILFSVILIGAGFYFHHITVPFVGVISLGWFGPVLTLIWFVGIINAINLIDGMDGLSSGTVLVGCLFIAAYGFKLHYPLVTMVALMLAGGVSAFLVFNFPPAEIFMGDSGSLFLGLAVGVLPLLEPAARVDGFALHAGITVFFVPLMDTIAAILRRIREKQSIQEGDRAHIHHKLLDFGLDTREVLSKIFLLEFLLGFALVLHTFRPEWNGIPLYISWVLGTIFFIILHYRRKFFFAKLEAHPFNPD